MRTRSAQLPILALLFAAALAPHPVVAGDEEDPKAEAAALVELARPLLRNGTYFDAIRKLKRAVRLDPGSEEAALLLAVAHRDGGEVEKAEAVLVPLGDSAVALGLLGEIRILRGDDAAAEEALLAALEADPDALHARQQLGALLEETGRRDEAIEQYLNTNTRWGRLQRESSHDDDLAEARSRLGIYRLSGKYKVRLNSVVDRLESVIKDDPTRVDALVAAGDLYLQFRDGGKDLKAKKLFDKALEVNPSYAPAMFGLARQAAFRYDDQEARKQADRARRTNGQYLPALLFLAQMDLGDGRYDKAEETLAAALSVNPRDTEARSTRAALLYLRGDRDGHAAEVAAILERNAFAATAHEVLASVLEEQRRFDEAFSFAQQAVETDPRDWDSYFLAARNALNVGADAKAEEYLEKAEEEDPFHNLYRTNFLTLFRKMRSFPTRSEDRFVVRLPPREDTPYYRLLQNGLRWSTTRLEELWQFEIEYPLYISVFDRQEDFATRTVGLPGFPALGACFGRVVTLDSPTALPPGAFNWMITLHHELAHVVTLQLSKGRVPRWLTEGISVYEERRVSPIWNREMERDLIDAIASDELLTLADINGAFRGPRILFAYYQGGLMSEFIVRDFGFPALREMVRLYGEELQTPEVVRTALGVEPSEFDRRFAQFAAEYVADLRILPRVSDAKMHRLQRHLRKERGDLEGWLLYAMGKVARDDTAAALSAIGNAIEIAPEDGRIPALRAVLAWNEGEDSRAVRHAEVAIAKGVDWFELRTGLGNFYARKEKDFETAEVHYRRAVELFPRMPGTSDPRLALAAMILAQDEGRMDEYRTLLQAHVDVDQDDVPTRMRLAELYQSAGLPDAELTVLHQLREVVPLPNGRVGRGEVVENHRRLGELLGARDELEEAELAYHCAVAVARMELGSDGGPPMEGPGLADLLVEHAETLHLLGRAEAARRAIREALAADPESEPARRLRDRLDQ